MRSGQRREAAIERQGLGSERAIADAKGGFGGEVSRELKTSEALDAATGVAGLTSSRAGRQNVREGERKRRKQGRHDEKRNRVMTKTRCRPDNSRCRPRAGVAAGWGTCECRSARREVKVWCKASTHACSGTWSGRGACSGYPWVQVLREVPATCGLLAALLDLRLTPLSALLLGMKNSVHAD